MSKTYVIAPAEGCWVLMQDDQVLDRYDSRGWAEGVGEVMVRLARQEGLSVSVKVFEPDGTAHDLLVPA